MGKVGVAYNIDWDIGFDDAYKRLSNLTVKEAAEAVEVPVERWANMNSDERYDYAYDYYRHSPSAFDDLFDLPQRVVLGDGIDEDEAAEWLTDNYGFCVSSLDVRMEDCD